MRTLAIDSATEACSVALFDGEECIAGDFRMLGRGHAEQLIPMIAALPQRGRANRIAVALGPGSFTGVRVGLAAARALAFAWSAQVVGYPTLALVAAMARAQAGESPVGVAMTGGHGEWFTQGFAGGGRETRALASLRPEDAAAVTDEALIAGSQAEQLAAIRTSGQALTLWPDARRLMSLPPADLAIDIRPLYGRVPDARIMGAPA